MWLTTVQGCRSAKLVVRLIDLPVGLLDAVALHPQAIVVTSKPFFLAAVAGFRVEKPAPTIGACLFFSGLSGDLDHEPAGDHRMGRREAGARTTS